MNDPVLAMRDVVVERNGRRVLDGISFDVPTGSTTAISGPSGAGKSTLLRLANRLDVPDSGSISYLGDDTAGMDVRTLRRQVGMVFQRPTAFPGTVRDNLAEAAADAAEEDMAAALAQAALGADMLDRDASQLSGGELQRVCLARTLITGPDVLLLDEPTSSLDDDAAGAFEQAARGLVGQGTTLVWVSHDRSQLERVADRVLYLANGRVRT